MSKKKQNDMMKERVKSLSRGAKHGDLYGTPTKKKKEKKKSKKKEPKISQRALYDITLNNFQFSIYTAMCMINGIDPNIYIYSDKTTTFLNANIKLDKTFKTMSKLDWETPKPINSMTFRGRFATILLLKIARNSHKIVKHLFEQTNAKKRYQSYNLILNEWIYQINTFVATYLSSDLVYEDHLEKIIEIYNVSEDLNSEIIGKLDDTRMLLREAINHPGKYEDGILCNNIMKMAYVLATDSLKVKRTPKYDEDLSFASQSQMGNQIGTLGYAIMHRRYVKEDDVPWIYDIFQLAKPEINSRFSAIDENPEILIGTKAITLLQILMGDPEIVKFIERLVK